MGSIARKELSGKTNSLPILVTASATPGTVIHTAVNVTDNFDEVWILATNPNATTAIITLEYYDGVTIRSKPLGLPPNGEYLIGSGISYGHGLVLRAFANQSNILIDGYVNRTTP